MSDADKSAPGMKILGLQVENIKRIRAVELKPGDGGVVEITGSNGAGKSSLLDAIWWAIADARHIQEVPIRKGADKALIRLDLGKLKVTRRFNAQEDGGYTTALKVENEEGASFKSPQAMLDALVEGLSFDPLAFTRMKPADQFEACRRFVPGVDFDAIAAAQREDFSTRTLHNRQAKEARAQADGVVLGDTINAERVDETALVAALEQAGVHNADIERRKANREKAQTKIADDRARAEEMLARGRKALDDAKRLEEELSNEASRLQAEAAELAAQIDAAGELPPAIDAGALRAEIERARAHNAVIDEALNKQKAKAAFTKAAQEHDAKSKELTEAMDKREADKRAAIAKAKLPIAGLSFGDNCVLLNELPFDQASGAEQLRASAAIAAAMNPKLRVLRIKDGALLGHDSFALLADFAKTNDMQIWVETVESSRPGAVVIEDGGLAGAAKTEAA